MYNALSMAYVNHEDPMELIEKSKALFYLSPYEHRCNKRKIKQQPKITRNRKFQYLWICSNYITDEVTINKYIYIYIDQRISICAFMNCTFRRLILLRYFSPRVYFCSAITSFMIATVEYFQGVEPSIGHFTADHQSDNINFPPPSQTPPG